MTSPDTYLIMTSAGLAGLAMLVTATLSGWRGWLALKRQEVEAHAEPRLTAGPSATSRIEIADLKERIRKLEAIAAGVDL